VKAWVLTFAAENVGQAACSITSVSQPLLLGSELRLTV
jgi:hypothetical protein